MAAVEVPRAAFARGELPAVCSSTGQPTNATAGAEGTRLPGWTLILLLFGILPFLVALLFARERVAGHLPFTPEAIARHRRLARSSDRALLVAAVWLVACAAVGLTLGLPDGAVELMAGVLVALLAAAVGYGLVAARVGVRVRPVASQAAVLITGAHPAFVAAVLAEPRPAPDGAARP